MVLKASELGFELSGAAPALPAPGYSDFLDWLARGCAGEMAYLERRRGERGDPALLLPGVRSVFCTALSYRPSAEHQPLLENHPISCYAWGRDYHAVVMEKLEILSEHLRRDLAPGCRTRAYVDTGPVLEKGYAARAGLGWIGKNTLLLNRRLGSFLFLGEILTDAEMDYGEPADNLCKTCTACLDACPTGALEESGFLNAVKCISYLNLEHRSDLPEGARLHGYLAGCDLCQTACPYNGPAPGGTEPSFQPLPEILSLTLEKAADMGPEEFAGLVRDKALERVKYPMWKRNAARCGPSPGQPRIPRP
jgi:epoxyqueuosine reductase